MNSKARPATAGWRLLIACLCSTIALAWATQASALTSITQGAFSAGATKITFESLPGDNSDIPPGFASGLGIASFEGATESEVYSDYSTALVNAAIAAGLGNVGATWGCAGTCGTGFTLTTAKNKVGMFLSSNVPLTVQITVLRAGVSLGSVTPSFAADTIGFVGFQDEGGIDQIIIGDNTADPGSINQLDNILLENAAGAGATVSAPTQVPTLSQWALIVLGGLLAATAVFALRWRR